MLARVRQCVTVWRERAKDLLALGYQTSNESSSPAPTYDLSIRTTVPCVKNIVDVCRHHGVPSDDQALQYAVYEITDRPLNAHRQRRGGETETEETLTRHRPCRFWATCKNCLVKPRWSVQRMIILPPTPHQRAYMHISRSRAPSSTAIDRWVVEWS